MIKKLLSLTAIAALVSANVVAQSNTKFETWGPTTTSNNNPTGWETLNVDKFGGPAGVTKETGNPGEGLISARLETKTGYGGVLQQDTATGLLTLNGNLIGGNIIGGIAYPGRPASVDVLVKSDVMPNDSALILFQLSKWNVGNNDQDVIGQAATVIPIDVAAWTTVNIPFNYVLPDTPDTLIVIMASSVGGVFETSLPQPGTVLWVDDIKINFPVGINQVKNSERIAAYPNPATSNLKVALNDTKASSIRITDMTGKVVKNEAVYDRIVNINVSSLPTGLYIYQVIDGENIIFTEKFNIVK
ncbi:MAG: T9SS type A sorting domain-containing protein [Flavobacteriales bacterium]|nr:T9SS type A sorting domain-containing protein [Flavobacteriales bacterium]